MFQTFLKSSRKNIGYTIDQTILVVAVIAILITLIIASVGWDLITRAGGTKLASYLKQVEDSIGSFYAGQGMWPDTALNADTAGSGANANDNLLVLQQNIFTAGTRFFRKHQNFLPGFQVDATNLLSPFGDGTSQMTLERVNHATNGFSDTFTTGTSFVLTIPGVTAEEAIQADDSIDGQDDFTAGAANGRVVLMSNGSTCDNSGTNATAGAGLVTLCYIANSVQ